MNSHVILVDENDNALGSMEKMEAHEKAVLHRAFSIFIFNNKGELLLQQRAKEKYHSPLLWTNSCCSHPQPGETTAAAAARRLEEEMGFTTPLSPAFQFTYKAEFNNGLTEHEFDHVFTGVYDGAIEANPAEVEAWRFVSTDLLAQEMQANPAHYTEWFKIAYPRLAEYLAAENKS
jgi:isopentenyl-diphosphate delta-isomerase